MSKNCVLVNLTKDPAHLLQLETHDSSGGKPTTQESQKKIGKRGKMCGTPRSIGCHPLGERRTADRRAGGTYFCTQCQDCCNAETDPGLLAHML